MPGGDPTQKNTVEVIAKAMMEVFSRTGLPEENLIDQGSVFVGCNTTYHNYLLGTDYLKTSRLYLRCYGQTELEPVPQVLAVFLTKYPTHREWDKPCSSSSMAGTS